MSFTVWVEGFEALNYIKVYDFLSKFGFGKFLFTEKNTFLIQVSFNIFTLIYEYNIDCHSC